MEAIPRLLRLRGVRIAVWKLGVKEERLLHDVTLQVSNRRRLVENIGHGNHAKFYYYIVRPC